MTAKDRPNLIPNIGAIAAGFIVAMLIAICIYKFGKVIDPPPEDIAMDDVRAVERFYLSHPVFLEFVLAGHLIGVFVGAFITSLLAKNHKKQFAFGVGGLCLVLGVIDILHFEHPLWFDVANTVGYLPLAFLGAKLGEKLSNSPNKNVESIPNYRDM